MTVKKNGWSPLHLWLQTGHVEVVEFLVEHGAEVAQIRPSAARTRMGGPLCICRCKLDMSKLWSSLLSTAQIRPSAARTRMGGPLCICRCKLDMPKLWSFL